MNLFRSLTYAVVEQKDPWENDRREGEMNREGECFWGPTRAATARYPPFETKAASRSHSRNEIAFQLGPADLQSSLGAGSRSP